MSDDTDIKLEDNFKYKWNFFYHDVDTSDFTEKSFKLVHEIYNIEDIIDLMKSIPTFQSGMFFLIREDCSPVIGKKGGMWSYKINKKYIDSVFENLCYLLCLNKISKYYDENIYGISLSPKINNTIIKIFTKDEMEISAKDKFYKIYDLDHNTAIFRLNFEPVNRFKFNKNKNKKYRG